VPLDAAKLHEHRCNESPLWGKMQIFGLSVNLIPAICCLATSCQYLHCVQTNKRLCTQFSRFFISKLQRQWDRNSTVCSGTFRLDIVSCSNPSNFKWIHCCYWSGSCSADQTAPTKDISARLSSGLSSHWQPEFFAVSLSSGLFNVVCPSQSGWWHWACIWVHHSYVHSSACSWHFRGGWCCQSSHTV